MVQLAVDGSLDFNLCIVCQTRSIDDLVEKPTSHDKLFSAIEERAKYGDVKFAGLWSVLKYVSGEERVGKVRWHRKCYQDTTHSGMLKRAKDRFKREAAGPDESRRKTSEALQVNTLFVWMPLEMLTFRITFPSFPFFLSTTRDSSPDQKLLLMTVMFVFFVMVKQNINNPYIWFALNRLGIL